MHRYPDVAPVTAPAVTDAREGDPMDGDGFGRAGGSSGGRFTRWRRTLLTCLGGLVLAGSCAMPKPPLPSKLVLNQGQPVAPRAEPAAVLLIAP